MPGDNSHIFRNQLTAKQLASVSTAVSRPLWAVILIVFVVVQTQASTLSLETDPYAFGITCAVIVVYAVLFLTNIPFNKSVLTSWTIYLDDLSITQQVKGMSDITLYHGEIKEITESSSGIIYLNGPKPNDYIRIPSTIERREELKQLLAAIQPIKSGGGIYAARDSRVVYFRILAYSSFLIACALCQQSLSAVVIGFVFNAVYAYYIFTNPYLSPRFKILTHARLATLILLLILSCDWNIHF